MSARDAWFRSPAWDQAAQAEFELRLARARDHSRPQYLRIKGLALREAGLADAARALMERVRTEYPTSMDATSALEHLADLARDEGRLDEAAQHYQTLLDGRSVNGTSQAMHVSLAEVMVRQRRFEAAADALLLRPVKDLGMNHLLFRWHACAAEVAVGLGDREEAMRAARRALDLIGAPDQFSRHPGVGRVRSDSIQSERLRDLAEGRVSASPGGDEARLPLGRRRIGRRPR